jgi:LPS export ABC transporter protein LptC
MDRKRLIAIAVALFFAGLLWWVSNLFRLTEAPLVTGAPDTPDYTIEGMHVTNMDSRGRKSYELRATRLAHFPAEKLSRLDKVHLIQYQSGGIQIDTRADTARYPDDGKEIYMERNVHIVRMQNGRVVGDIRTGSARVLLKP